LNINYCAKLPSRAVITKYLREQNVHFCPELSLNFLIVTLIFPADFPQKKREKQPAFATLVALVYVYGDEEFALL
jgi:hypothetical protein